MTLFNDITIFRLSFCKSNYKIVRDIKWVIFKRFILRKHIKNLKDLSIMNPNVLKDFIRFILLHGNKLFFINNKKICEVNVFEYPPRRGDYIILSLEDGRDVKFRLDNNTRGEYVEVTLITLTGSYHYDTHRLMNDSALIDKCNALIINIFKIIITGGVKPW